MQKLKKKDLYKILLFRVVRHTTLILVNKKTIYFSLLFLTFRFCHCVAAPFNALTAFHITCTQPGVHSTIFRTFKLT